MLQYFQGNPGNYVAPSAPLTLYGQIDRTIKYLRLINNSPYALTVNLDGQITNVSEFWQKDIQVPSYNQGNLIITPTLVIQTSSHAQAYQLQVQGLVDGDNGGTLDSSITQQAVTATASGSPIFSTFFGVTSSAGNNQSLNLFNPANSGVIATFHLAQAFTNSSGIPTANLIYLSGADLNFSGSANAKSHTGTANPPNSVMHITTDDSSSGFGGTAIRVARLTGSSAMATSELLPFPDNFTLYPGGNLRLSVADTTAGHVVEINLGWAEQVVVPPILVLGPNMVANAVDNENNPVGTSIIKSGIASVGNPIQIFNDGSSTWMVDASGVLHQVLKTNLSANFLQLGQSGDIVEILGQLLADQLLTAALGIKLTGITSPAIDGSSVLGAVVLKLLAGSLSRLVTVGQTTIANAGTTVTHTLGAIPTFVVPVHDLGAANADVIGVNYGTMTTTTFVAYSSNAGGSGNVRFLVYGA